MALNLPTSCPIFTPLLNPSPAQTRPSTEVRFAWWNNANAEKFNQRRRAQQEIEDDIRREHYFDSSTRIATTYDSDADSPAAATTSETFKSRGTPSSPSRPSIPGKKSKYSKNPDPNESHPAFRRVIQSTKVSSIAQDQNHAAFLKNGSFLRFGSCSLAEFWVW